MKSHIDIANAIEKTKICKDERPFNLNLFDQSHLVIAAEGK